MMTTNDDTEQLDELLEGFEVTETNHLYHHEHDKDKLKLKLKAWAAKQARKAKIMQLEDLQRIHIADFGREDYRSKYTAEALAKAQRIFVAAVLAELRGDT